MCQLQQQLAQMCCVAKHMTASGYVHGAHTILIFADTQQLALCLMSGCCSLEPVCNVQKLLQHHGIDWLVFHIRQEYRGTVCKA